METRKTNVKIQMPSQTEYNLQKIPRAPIVLIKYEEEKQQEQQRFCCFAHFLLPATIASFIEHVCNVYEMNSWHTREKDFSFASETISKVFHFWTHFSFLPNPLFLPPTPPPPAPRITQSCNGRRWQLYHRSVHVTQLSSVLNVIETFWWLRCFSKLLVIRALFSLSLSFFHHL